MKISFFLIIFLYTGYASALEITSNTAVANAGYYQLSWTDSTLETVIVEESPSQSFSNPKEIYRGKDSSTAISGKPNGTYFYRIKSANSPAWSQSINVKVEHHSITKAFLFFFFGFFVFASTCFIIIRNHKPSL